MGFSSKGKGKGQWNPKHSYPPPDAYYFGMGRGKQWNKSQGYHGLQEVVKEVVQNVLSAKPDQNAKQQSNHPVAWTCNKCQATHHNKNLQKCRVCQAPRTDPKGPQPASSPSALPSASLSSSILEKPSFLQVMSQHAGAPAPSKMEVETDTIPMVVDPPPASNGFSDNQTLLQQAQEAYQMMLAKFGPDAPVTQTALRAQQDAEKKLSGVNLAKHNLTIDTQILALVKERAGKVEMFGKWEKKEAQEIKQRQDTLEQERLAYQNYLSRVDANLEQLRQAAKTATPESPSPADAPPPAQANVPQFSHVNPELLTQIGTVLNDFVKQVNGSSALQDLNVALAPLLLQSVTSSPPGPSSPPAPTPFGTSGVGMQVAAGSQAGGEDLALAAVPTGEKRLGEVVEGDQARNVVQKTADS